MVFGTGVAYLCQPADRRGWALTGALQKPANERKVVCPKRMARRPPYEVVEERMVCRDSSYRCRAVKRTRMIVLTVAVSFFCAACSPPDATPPEVDEIHPVTSAKDIVLPFHEYQLSAAELNVVERATAVLAKDCMNRFELDWPAPAAELADTDGTGNGDRYGVIDRAEVAEWGYHRPPEQQEPREETSPAPEAVMVYTGRGASEVGGRRVPEGGCVGEARRHLTGNAPTGMSGADLASLDQQIFQRAQADDRVRAAMGDWRECMVRFGYHYTDVWTANNDVRWGGPAPEPEELATATADLDCREESNLVPIWLAVETAYQRRAVADRADDFTVLRTRLTTTIENASHVLSAYG